MTRKGLDFDFGWGMVYNLAVQYWKWILYLGTDIMRGVMAGRNVFTAILYLSCFSSMVWAVSDSVVCKGALLDSQGNPVSGAHVFLYEMSYELPSMELSRKLTGQVTSDAQGQFILSAERSDSQLQRWGTILVAKKGLSLRWCSWDLQRDKVLSLQMGSYKTLSGEVVDEDGLPVAGVSVRAMLMLDTEFLTDDVDYFDWLTERTDETGCFTFNFIPADATADFYVETGEQTYCTAEQGIAGNRLNYSAGERAIRIVLSDKLAMQNSTRSISYGTMLANSRYIHLTSQRIQANNVIEVSPVDFGRQSISGMVIEEPFVPLADVTISIYDVFKDRNQPYGFVIKALGETVTDSSGQYEFERTDYDHDVDHRLLIAHKDDYALAVQSFSSMDSALEPLVMTFGHKQYTGQVVDAEGQPIAGARVSAFVSSFIKPADIYVSNPQEKEAAQTQWLTVTTDQDGQFEISNMPLFARAEFSVSADGYGSEFTWRTDERLDEMTIPAGGKPLLFTLQKIGGIRGRLIEQDSGDPISNERIFILSMDNPDAMAVMWHAVAGVQIVSDEGSQHREVSTDTDGYFIVSDLAPGQYRVSLNPFLENDQRWCAEAQIVELPEGEGIDVTLSAMPLATVQVLVQDNNRQPLREVNVTLTSRRAFAAAPTQKTKSIRQSPGRLTFSHTAPAATTQNETPKRYDLSQVTFVPAGSSESQVLVQMLRPSDDAIILPVKTNENGIAVFRIPPGEYVIASATKANYDYTPTGDVITAQLSGRLDRLIQMNSMQGFGGRCLDGAGGGIASAEIQQLGFADPISTSDDEGSFGFDLSSLRNANHTTKCLQYDSSYYRRRDRAYDRTPHDLIIVGKNSVTREYGWCEYTRQKRVELSLQKAVQLTGQVMDDQKHPVEAHVTVYAYPKQIGWMSHRQSFKERHFLYYDSVETEPDGTFSISLIRDFSYIVQVQADGYGSVYRKIISLTPYRSIPSELIDAKDSVDDTLVMHYGDHVVHQKARLWVLRKESSAIDMRTIKMPLRNLSVSGVIVDRMGHPLEGYHVYVSGIGQVEDDEGVVTNASGQFSFSNLCEGEVEIYAEKDDYHIFQTIQAGEDPLRLVSMDHVVEPSSEPNLIEDSLADLEVVLVNADTQEVIHCDKAGVIVEPEKGKKIHLDSDEEGRYRLRLEPGKYTVGAEGYPYYHYNRDIAVTLKVGQQNTLRIPLKKNPVINGIVHLPDSVSSDQISFYVHPDTLFFKPEVDIAGDGQFVMKLQYTGGIPDHIWLWVHTPDRGYVSRTKVSLDEPWVDINLEPEATVQFEKSKQHSSIFEYSWSQTEYSNKCSSTIGCCSPRPGMFSNQSMRDFMVKNDNYIGCRGLVAGQNDLTYSFLIAGFWKPILVPSTDLKAGEVTIIELPEK